MLVRGQGLAESDERNAGSSKMPSTRPPCRRDLFREGIGYGHRGLTFSSESKAWWFDPALGHHILGVHSEDPAGFVMIQPRRLSVIGTSVTPRHI